ncbi:MAG: signal peptide peptidase SppA [Bacillota bacterium]|nr:signal peptide peptidase SppA [Bacillota bacterium]
MNRKVWAGIILGLALVSLIVVAALGFRGPGIDYHGHAGQAIGIVRVEGIIVGGRSGSFLDATSAAEDIVDQLRRARKDPAIKAVVIRLDSPGGSAPASLEIGEEVARVREAGKVVVASMGDTAASGAYWIAARSNTIVANPATLTGSIGVIIQTQRLMGLYDKLGIDTETYKSGPFKDMGSPSRPPTEEERAIFQGIVDEMYREFVAVVANGRGMSLDRVRELADGRVYTGRQAHELGLVDRLGDFEDAVRLAADMAGVRGEPELVEMSTRSPWEELFGGFSSSLAGRASDGLWLIMDPLVVQR